MGDSLIEEAKMSPEEWKKSRGQFQWKYSGRSGGWWAFDKVNNKELEEHYEKHRAALAGNTTPPEVILEIGMREYVIDFAQMTQAPMDHPNRTRRIERSTAVTAKDLKGQGGKFFVKKKKRKT